MSERSTGPSGSPSGADRPAGTTLRTPELPETVVERPRVLTLFDPSARVNLLVAPPGYGKSVAARQWADASGLPTAWLSVDLLDANPISFWFHLIAAVRTAVPGVDGEPAAALAESPWSSHFLAVLLAQVEAADSPGLLVVDDVGRLDLSVFDGLALLVERVGDRMRMCLTARTAPPVPLARWYANGWLAQVTADDLRFRGDEAWAVARARTTGPSLDARRVDQLNHQVDGWPIAFSLALLSRDEGVDPDGGAATAPGTERLLTDYVVAEVLGCLGPVERELALVLSVVDWFDATTVRALAGPTAPGSVAELVRLHLAAPVPGGPPGTLRFHPLVRDTLDDELRWRDPDRHARLHREAAVLAVDRDDLNSAYRHLTAAGDDAAANALLVEPVLDLVDRGDLAGIRRLIGSFPLHMDVEDPALALDLAVSFHFVGSQDHAVAWSDRAAELGAGASPLTGLRLHAVRSMIALARGEVAEAARHVAAVESLAAAGRVGAGPIERRFPPHAAQVAIAQRDVAGARRWLERSQMFGGPHGPVGEAITLPVLAASVDLLAGRVVVAGPRACAACDAAEEMGLRPHPGALEALVIAARCHLAGGRWPAADEYAGAARSDAELLGSDRPRVLAGAVAAEVALHLDGPEAALAVVRDLAAQVGAAAPQLLVELELVRGRALLRGGRREAAREVADGLPRSPRAALLAAAIAVADGRASEVAAVLAGSSGWPLAERLEAVVLGSLVGLHHGRTHLADALEEGWSSGWVSPFIGHGPRVDAMLLEQPLERLHPEVLAHLRTVPAAATIPRIDLVDPITPREQTILELLPSHLSYAQIGERLFLSVNTVKSNLKVIYRKLGVTTRADAVQAARAGGLL